MHFIAPQKQKTEAPTGELTMLPSISTRPFSVLVYKALHHLAAPYLVDDCQLIVSIAGRRRLRSAYIDTCIVPRTNTCLGDRNFVIAGPRLWNSLPAELRQPDIELEEFRRLLKTFLFV